MCMGKAEAARERKSGRPTTKLKRGHPKDPPNDHVAPVQCYGIDAREAKDDTSEGTDSLS